MSEPARANARRVLTTLAVVGGPVALVGVLAAVAALVLTGRVLAALAVLVAALVVAAVAMWRIRTGAVDNVLRSSGARPVGATEYPRLHNLIEGLCVSSGVPMPDLYLVDDSSLNVMVLGNDQRDTAIVFTRGMLDQLDRIELEGVIAHQLARVRHNDVAPATVAAVVARWVPSVPARVLAPDRIISADLEACQLTRYPPGLIGALGKMAGVSTVTPASTPSTAHLWFAPPQRDASSSANVPPLHPPLDERIALLREL